MRVNTRNIVKSFALLKQPIRCDKVVSGSVAEWLKAHDSKSCRRATVSKVRILSLPPFAQVWCKCTDSFFESNPFASAIFLCYN